MLCDGHGDALLLDFSFSSQDLGALYRLALRLGDLCAEAGHPWWALKVWQMAARLIADRDYDDWIGVWLNTDRVRLSHVVAEAWCLDLGRRIDALWCRLGHQEMGWWEAKVQASVFCYPKNSPSTWLS